MSFALKVSFYLFLKAYGVLYYERYKGFSHRFRFRRRARGLVWIRRRPSNTRERAEDPGFNSPRARQRLSRRLSLLLIKKGGVWLGQFYFVDFLQSFQTVHLDFLI